MSESDGWTSTSALSESKRRPLFDLTITFPLRTPSSSMNQVLVLIRGYLNLHVIRIFPMSKERKIQLLGREEYVLRRVPRNFEINGLMIRIASAFFERRLIYAA